MLIPLRFNELLCRPWILPFNYRSRLPSLRFIQLSFRFYAERHNAGLQLRRAISIQPEEIELLEKHAIAPSAARLCWIASRRKLLP